VAGAVAEGLAGLSRIPVYGAMGFHRQELRRRYDRPRESWEPVCELAGEGGAFRLRIEARAFNYDTLGDGLAPSSGRNFAALLSRVFGRAVGIALDGGARLAAAGERLGGFRYESRAGLERRLRWLLTRVKLGLADAPPQR
jgi:hypothetical protein